MLIWKIPYTYLLILLISLFWWIVYRWRLRKVARAIRFARDSYDTLLQTVEAAKLVADDALERPHDTAHLHDAMKKLSSWFGPATQEGQKVLNALSSSTIEKLDL